MSSTSIRRRQVKRGKAEVRHRKPGEVRTAWIAGALIVGFTLFAIWILRPGGLAQRQPRATALVSIALFATTIIVALAVRPPTPRVARRRSTWVPVSLVCVMVGMLVLWMAWGFDLVKHYPSTTSPEVQTTPRSVPTSAPTSAATTTPVTTAAPDGAPTATTAPASAPGG